MGKIGIVIADDHVGLREALAGYIDTQADMEVVAQASTGAEAVQKTAECMPDVLLVDITMPDGNGIEVIKAIQAQCPSVRSLVLTMHEDKSFLTSVLLAGGSGYVTKRAAGDELLKALREVAKGNQFINTSLQEADLNPSQDADRTAVNLGRSSSLSGREREVLSYVAHGHTSKEIADKLGISRPTVDSYRLRLSEKLGLKSRAELVRFALDQGLLHP